MKGEFFMERRREDNLETLFLDMKATMPRGNPGSLPDQTYVDIISYVLQTNEMPAGSTELKPDVLDKVDVGGSEAFIQSRATVHGSSQESGYYIDGLDGPLAKRVI